jgi:molybdate/tungstate transport system ATP-binding protein
MLDIEALRVEYDSFTLGPLDLSIGKEVLAVLGPSGCGKTTLLHAIAGHRRVAGGRITLSGRDLDGVSPSDRGTPLVFQSGALFPHMSARENISYPGASPERVEAVAGTLAVSDVLDRQADTLSGGERQRVALARALAANPSALLLDEPLSNLDTPIRRQLRADLREILSDLDIPVLYVTHDQRSAAAVGDRLAVLKDGRVTQIGTPTEVFHRPATPFVATFTGGGGLIRGTVVDTSEDRGVAIGDDVLEVPISAAGGSEVTLAVHREMVSLTLSPGPNRLPGTVRNVVFEGDRYRVQIRLRAGPSIEATLPPRTGVGDLPDDRDTVWAHLPPSALSLVRED